MGLVRTTFTAQDSDTAVARFKGTSTTNRAYNSDDGRKVFVSNFVANNRVAPYEVMDQLHRSSRITIQTDAQGVKNLTVSLSGKCNYSGGVGSSNAENERYYTGPIYWGVSTSSTSRPSTYNIVNITSSWSGSQYIAAGSFTSTQNDINLVPNTTFYLWIWYNSSSNNASKLIGLGTSGLTLTATGVYGEPGDITADDGYFGDAMSISYASPTSGATYTVKTSTVVESGGNNGTTLYEETLQTTDAASSLSWTPALATYAPKLLNRGSTTCTITVQTYFGTALAGTKQKTITLSFDPADVGPTLATGCFGVAPLNEGAVSGLSGYIQGYSKARASYDSSKVTLQQGATVQEWRVQFGNATEEIVAASTTNKDSAAVTADMTVTCTLVDSRGLTAQQAFSIMIYTYTMPSLNADYYRCAAGSDTQDDNGTRLALLPVVTFSSLNNQNSITFTFKWRIVGSSTWTDKTNDASPALASGTKSFFTSFQDNNYELWMIVTDTLGNTAEWTRSVPSSKHFLTSTTGWDGAAFGKVANYSGELDIGTWDLRCNNIIINNEDLGALLAQIKAALNIS